MGEEAGSPGLAGFCAQQREALRADPFLASDGPRVHAERPTLWVPHSYPACAQHAPNEHLLASVAREGLAIMAGLFWDLGEPDAPWEAGRVAR